MSFVKMGRTQNKVKRPLRLKKAVCPKKDWVNTVTDLSVHKLTPAELNYRHEIHKSRNKAAAQWELKEKALRRRLRHNGSPVPLDEASLSIIKEVFSDQLLLQDVLARSDKALAVVKDLFGDAPQRHIGNPSVTVAPNCDSDSELPVRQRPDPPTHLSLLSQSMMDPEALNELDISKDEDVVRRNNIRKMKLQRHKDNVLVSPCPSGKAPDQTALNATAAVRRVQSKQSQVDEDKKESPVSQVLNPELSVSESGRVRKRANGMRKSVSQSSDGLSVSSLSGNQSSLGLLQALLGQVEADLDTVSPDTVSPLSESLKKPGLTGFSVALVSTLGRLVQIIKQQEAGAKKEAKEKKRLEEMVKEQRGLLDALTAETMTLREEMASLQAGLQKRTAVLEERLDTVMSVLERVDGQFDVSLNSYSHAPVHQTAAFVEGIPEPTHVSPAILLSPPQQRDNWQNSSGPHLNLQHQHSSVNVQDHNGASSRTCTQPFSPTSDPGHLQFSPEALLAEINLLSRENEMMKAQLGQAKCFSNDSRRMNSTNTGRLSSHSDGEWTISASSTTRQSSQSIQASGDTFAEQAMLNSQKSSETFNKVSSNTSVNSVELRLLELNRQSAAARSRLLDLIELQKQSIAIRVSPSVSPVPSSAFNMNTTARRESPETLMMPEWESRLHTGGQRRSCGSDASPNSFVS